ncbi:beta family protein [Microbacterium sp. Leaf151]|uniref:beta family protein n=1 Tax=Microbacterium sp. Leaf151 TaxID=1736276 RepID=UPI0009EA7E30|nr:hypothetical protein [Microbacterium sp. Leaf151]
MGKIYRPFTLARAGELAALARVSGTTSGALLPVFQIAPRTWDYEKERYSKTISAHLAPLPEKLASVWGGGSGYVDVSMLDSEPIIDGQHPLAWLAAQTRVVGTQLAPLVEASSSASAKAAAANLHVAHGTGVGIRLRQIDWTTIDPARLTTLLGDLGVAPNVVDVFVDFEGAEGAVIEVAVIAELTSLRALGPFRSITVGGAGFPDVNGVPRGTTEYPRDEWRIYSAVRAKLASMSQPTPDFFDNLVLKPDTIELGVDPRFISISAALRYTVTNDYLLAKGELFKGQGGSGKGGAALIPALDELTRHAEYATPVRSQADDWIEAVVAGSATPGNPGKWREWGTVRHIEVVAFQLSTLT